MQRRNHAVMDSVETVKASIKDPERWQGGSKRVQSIENMQYRGQLADFSKGHSVVDRRMASGRRKNGGLREGGVDKALPLQPDTTGWGE